MTAQLTDFLFKENGAMLFCFYDAEVNFLGVFFIFFLHNFRKEEVKDGLFSFMESVIDRPSH